MSHLVHRKTTDTIMLEIDFGDLARDKVDMDQMNDMMCRAMREAGIPITYIINPLTGLYLWTGLESGSIDAKNLAGGRSRLITWRADLFEGTKR